MKASLLIVLCMAILAVPMNLFAGEAEDDPMGCQVTVARDVSDILEHGGMYMPPKALFGATFCVEFRNDTSESFYILVDVLTMMNMTGDGDIHGRWVELIPGQSTKVWGMFPRYFTGMNIDAFEGSPGLTEEYFYR